MNDRTLYALWGIAFAVTAGLGLIPEPAGVTAWVMLAVSLLFFVPPGLLLYRGWQSKDAKKLALVRNLAIASLSLTTAALVANFLSALAPEAVGDFLHAVLAVVSAPMLCCGYWAVSLFLWSCLLVSGITALQKIKQ